MKPFFQPNKGYSLIELVIVLLLIGILATAATPLYKSFFEQKYSQAEAQKLISALQLTRASAIDSGMEVTLCGTNAQRSCISNWSKNLVLFFDKNANRQIDDNESIIHSFSAAPKGSSIEWRSTFKKPYLRFKPDGSAKEAGNIKYCGKSKLARFAQMITINYSGRAYLRNETDSNKIVLTSNKQAIEC